MNQRLLSGLTATLLVSTIGVAPSSTASELILRDEQLAPSVPAADSFLKDGVEADSNEADSSAIASQPNVSPPETSDLQPLSSPSSTTDDSEAEEVVKVGEYQSQVEAVPAPSVAEIYAHEMDGRPAATVYVSGIPVLTIVGDSEAATPSTSASEPVSAEAPDDVTESSEPKAFTAPATDAEQGSSQGIKMATDATKSSVPTTAQESEPSAEPTVDNRTVRNEVPEAAPASAEADEADPVWRATAIAAQINQLYRSGVDAEDIIAEWDEDLESYVITVGDDVLLEFDNNIMLPDTTEDTSQDVLQATNRIRRLLGGADPLAAVEGEPQVARAPQVSFGSVAFTFSGMASWYGPGFNGRRSASGEVFNQNALTAAHRSLPFGTLVRVTNMNTGANVVVRINDRGPYSHGRVIDLSAAAARAIGIMQAGVGQVQVDVVN
ncbi:MAG: septal ring lytic transglycosylase RlpA family protein [Elainellaceae cyanobacterium]